MELAASKRIWPRVHYTMELAASKRIWPQVHYTMELAVSLLLFVFAVGVLVGQQPRESVKFDFAWRFHLWDLNLLLHCNDSALPCNLTRCTAMIVPSHAI